MNMKLLNMVRSILIFKNEKLMFWVDLFLCVVSMINKVMYHALGNKTPYEILYGHIPSVRHLIFFGSTCYALISKEKRNNIGARIWKCIFLGYSYTTKSYHIYNEANKNFIISRDVVFLESTKIGKTIEWKLDHMDRFTHVNTISWVLWWYSTYWRGDPYIGSIYVISFWSFISISWRISSHFIETWISIEWCDWENWKNCTLMGMQHHLNQWRNLDHDRNFQSGS